MKVRATQLGYYNHKRRPPGEVFILRPYKKTVEELDEATKFKTKKQVVVSAEEQFSFRWMERVDQNVSVKQEKIQKKFGKGLGNQALGQDVPSSARAAHEPMSDDEVEDLDAAIEEHEAAADNDDRDVL